MLIGYHGDLNETYPVGKIDEDSERLIRTTRQSLDEAIKICKPGALFRDVGKVMFVPGSLIRSPYTDEILFLPQESQSLVQMVVLLSALILVTASMTSSIVHRTFHIMPKIRRWAV